MKSKLEPYLLLMNLHGRHYYWCGMTLIARPYTYCRRRCLRLFWQITNDEWWWRNLLDYCGNSSEERAIRWWLDTNDILVNCSDDMDYSQATDELNDIGWPCWLMTILLVRLTSDGRYYSIWQLLLLLEGQSGVIEATLLRTLPSLPACFLPPA